MPIPLPTRPLSPAETPAARLGNVEAERQRRLLQVPGQTRPGKQEATAAPSLGGRTPRRVG